MPIARDFFLTEESPPKLSKFRLLKRFKISAVSPKLTNYRNDNTSIKAFLKSYSRALTRHSGVRFLQYYLYTAVPR